MRNTQMDRLLLNTLRCKCLSLQHAHIWSHLQYSCAIARPLWKHFRLLTTALVYTFALEMLISHGIFAVTAVTPRTASAEKNNLKKLTNEHICFSLFFKI